MRHPAGEGNVANVAAAMDVVGFWENRGEPPEILVIVRHLIDDALSFTAVQFFKLVEVPLSAAADRCKRQIIRSDLGNVAAPKFNRQPLHRLMGEAPFAGAIDLRMACQDLLDE